MPALNFTLELLSDAEPSTGFGTEMVNSLVPRNFEGCPIIPATHLKGLMRENLLLIAENLDQPDLRKLILRVFGKPGGIDEGTASLLNVSDAIAPLYTKVLTVTRTSLNEHGTAEDTSLRTTECIAIGTKFKGQINLLKKPESVLQLIVQLGLLSISAIGSSRNRGCGECKVNIDGLTDGPGATLKRLIALPLKENLPLIAEPIKINISGNANEFKILKLTFTANGPTCLPETPIVGNNTIKTGFACQASAVQGMILHKINNYLPHLATACFENPHFRVWPLLPTILNSIAIPVRASATHRISKLEDASGKYTFADDTIENYDWKNQKSPLKVADGVLQAMNGGGVQLWRAADMTHLFSAHGVHHDQEGENGDGRNLFTVEALAPMTFSGLVSLPTDAASALVEILKQDNFVQLGKARSIRGGGTLKAEIVKLEEVISQSNLGSNFKNRAFIVQSPILVPDEIKVKDAKTVINTIVNNSGWGEVEYSSGNINVLFGWNRHNKGNSIKGLLKAKRVIMPGSIFLLKKPVDDLQNKLVLGLGDGKTQGFGAVLPHPGVASQKYKENISIPELKDENLAGKVGFDLFFEAESSGLTASQISFLRNKLSVDKESALKYLDHIKTDRPKHIYDRWEGIMKTIKDEVQKNHHTALDALKVWQDLVVAKGVV